MMILSQMTAVKNTVRNYILRQKYVLGNGYPLTEIGYIQPILVSFSL